MDNSEESSKDNSNKDLRTSQSSLKSTKSLEKSANSGSLKSEKGYIQFKGDDNQKSDVPTKVPHKIIANWRHACDKTKDKTKDLLKRWRTLPEIETNLQDQPVLVETNSENSGWSVHVWTTWVDRFSIESDTETKENCQLTPIQTTKFSHFFSCLLDYDQDNLICEQDFEILIERLRHFADWSVNSTEFNILREVERGFIETFLCDVPENDKFGFTLNDEVYLTKDGWLYKWSQLICGSRNLFDFPVWLQFFAKVLFQVINRSGTGIITKDELNAFYSSVLGLESGKVDDVLHTAYQAMTSNGDHPLIYRAYRLCFANYLLGRYPNGPGQHILGAPPNAASSALFPVDYSALNAQPEDLEQYTPDQKSNRRSIIV